VNRFETTEPSPLTADLQTAVQAADADAGRLAVEGLARWREQRDDAAVADALARVSEAARSGDNLMDATVAAARSGVTTGEWAGVLREVFGEFRAPTGVTGAFALAECGADLARVRDDVRRTGQQLGTRLRLLVGKPGLDGHSNGAEQVAVRARDAGFEVVYQGIRLTPAEIVSAAVAEDVHCVGLSILSGSHMELVPQVLRGLRDHGLDDVPVVVGGIVPAADAARLADLGVAAVFTPKDFGLTDVLGGIVAVIRRVHGLDAATAGAAGGTDSGVGATRA
jgi:(2R)-ethylmalonyl-CoA mutase